MVLSFIIPVFNGAAHLGKCLASILDGDTTDIEVLVVNDSSTDSTASVIRDWAQADGRVRAFHQNSSKLVGYCRNIGLEHAKGEYVWFVDADDWLSPGAVPQVLQLLEQHAGAHILSFGYAEHYGISGGEGTIIYKLPIRENRERSHILNFLKVRAGYSSMPFSYIFQKDFLDSHAIRFPEGIYFEDLYFTGKAFYLAGRVILIRRIFYNYNRTNAASITLVQTKKKIYDLLASYSMLRLLFGEEQQSSGYNSLLAFRFIVYGLPRCFRMFLRLPPEDRKDDSLRAELSKFRKSPIMKLKSIGQAAIMARALSADDPLQRSIFRRNICLLLKMKYTLRLVLWGKGLRTFGRWIPVNLQYARILHAFNRMGRYF